MIILSNSPSSGCYKAPQASAPSGGREVKSVQDQPAYLLRSPKTSTQLIIILLRTFFIRYCVLIYFGWDSTWFHRLRNSDSGYSHSAPREGGCPLQSVLLLRRASLLSILPFASMTDFLLWSYMC
jgi:hypothetical protein